MSKKVKNKNSSQGQSLFASQVQSDLKQKLNPDKRKDVDLNLSDKSHDDNQSKKLSFKQKWQNQVVDQDVIKEAKDYKQILQRCIGGSLLGSNSIVYGSSTSLYACHHSSFENIVNRCCDLFAPKSFLDFCWKLLWLLPVLITFLVVCIALYAIDAALFNAGYELILIFCFIGINIVGIGLLLFLPKYRPNNLINKNSFKDDQSKLWSLIIVVFIALLLIGLAFIPRFAWNQGYPLGHINYSQYVDIVGINNVNITNNIGPDATIETSYALQILAGGFLCGLTMFIPGLSGSYMLSIVGANSYLNTATRYAFAGYSPDPSIAISSNWAWTTIVISFIGLICGFIASCFIARYLINKRDNLFKNISFAAACSLFISIFIALSSYDYDAMQNNSILLAICIAALFVITVGGALGMWWYGHKHSLSLSWMWTE